MTSSLNVLVHSKVRYKLKIIEIKTIKDIRMPKNQKHFIIGAYLLLVSSRSIDVFDIVKRHCKIKSIPLPFFTSHFPTQMKVIKRAFNRKPLYLHIHYEPSTHIILNLANFSILSVFMTELSLSPTKRLNSYIPHQKHNFLQS